MLKKIAKYAALVTVMSAATAQALPIIEADAFTVGDNQAMQDTTSGLVWMDHGVNSSKSFNQVVNELDTTYKGWRLPTEQEVVGLYTTLFAHQPGYQQRENWWHSWDSLLQTPVTEEFKNIFTIFGANSFFASDQPYNWSWFLDSSDQLQSMSFFITNDFNAPGNLIGVASLCCFNYGVNYDSQRDEAGWTTLLVRKDVPEPSVLILLGLGLLGLGLQRKRV